MVFSLLFCRDIFQYLDEETQDAVFYQEEDESTFESVSLLAQKLEKEINHLFQNKSPTVLVGLMSTTKQVASHLIELSGNSTMIYLFIFIFRQQLEMRKYVNNYSNYLIDFLTDNEPYGVKGARVILKFRTLNGEEQTMGSFLLDPNTVSIN